MPRMHTPWIAHGRRSFTAATAILVWAVFQPQSSRAATEEVSVPESVVRSAPFDVAPEVARVHLGDRLPADDQPHGSWRRVRLPDGRYGFLRDVDAKTTATLPPVASEVATNSGDPGPTQRPALPTGPTLFGVMLETLPVGTLKATTASDSSNASVDSVFALAVAPFLDVPASPYFAVGISPQVIFRVKGDGSPGPSATEFDFRGRLTGRLPMSPKARVYGRLSPAYSVISLPAPPSNATSRPDPKGFLLDFSVGTEVALLPDLFIVIDLGYQLGFQSSSTTDGSTTFDGSRYLHVGGGLAVGL